MALLEVDSLTKHFAAITAVDDASFEVREGEILGLAGPNGAGKTVTFNCITGQLQPDAGTVVFDGEDITGHPPDEVARAGVGRTFQEVRVYDELTTRENLQFAAQDKGIGRMLASIVSDRPQPRSRRSWPARPTRCSKPSNWTTWPTSPPRRCRTDRRRSSPSRRHW